MDVVVSELDGSWLRFVLGIPLDVLVILSVFYLSASLSFYLLQDKRRAAPAISVTLSAIVFGCYYLYVRTNLLDLPFVTLLLDVLLSIGLVLAPALIASDRLKTIKIVKLITVAKVRSILEYGIVVVALIVLAPVMFLIAVLIKLTTRGSILVKRPGSSHSGRSITLYSFRTMVPMYHYSIATFNMSSLTDWRFTGFGRFLHKSSLHLLPRLFNVLNGDLHLVGVTPLHTKLLVSKFSQELLKREYDLVEGLYNVRKGDAFTRIVDYCIPTGVITYSDLNAYKLHPSKRTTVIKFLDKRPRLSKEADYFVSTTLPSIRLLIVLGGKFILRLLTAFNLLRLEEVDGLNNIQHEYK